MAKKKFDTNPLDPEFPQRAAEQQRQAEAAANSDAQTRHFSPHGSVTEDATRRYDNTNFQPPFIPPFNGQNIPQSYQAGRFAEMNEASNRTVPKVRMPEKWLIGLPYLPWYIGLIASLVILFIVPKSETKVRFHAAQGLAAHIGILIVTTILGIAGNATDLADVGNFVFQIATTIMLIIFAFKAWQGKPVHIESVDDLTNWLEEKIEPKK